MEAIDKRIVAAWQAAAEDLGLSVVSPFDAARVGGGATQVEAYLPDFGSAEGIILVSFARRIKLGALSLQMSILPKEYRKYQRKMFIDALSDFGWYGSGAAPDWLKAA